MTAPDKHAGTAVAHPIAGDVLLEQPVSGRAESSMTSAAAESAVMASAVSQLEQQRPVVQNSQKEGQGKQT